MTGEGRRTISDLEEGGFSMSAPLNPNDTAVLLFDLQEGVVELSKTVEVLSIRRATEWLLRCARRFDVPVIVTTAGVPGESGPVRVVPEIEEVLGSRLAHHVPGRPTANAFTHPPAASKIASLGRKTLLIGGVLTEVAIQNTALSGVERGYDVQLVMDACGGISPRTEDAALRRLTQAGVTCTSCASIAGQLIGDFTQSPAGVDAMKILFEIAAFVSA